jgi:hypothetical protein
MDNSTTAAPAVKFRENATTSVTRDATAITVHVRGILQPIVLRFAQLSQRVKDEAMGYGMEVRLTRAAALERDTKSGRSASAQEKHDAIARLAAHYASGTDAWAMAGGGGGGLSADTRALIEALVRVFELDGADAEARVREMTGADRDALRVDPEIKPTLDAVYAERARVGGAASAKALIEGLRAAKRA